MSGAINIDADLVVGVESGGDIISLANGCVCCSIRDDLLAAVFNVMERPERPDYIVLEASGVAEPSGIAATFMEERLRDRLRLDSIMCVMDASQIFAAPEMMDLKLRQIAFADMLILNKSDLVGRDEIARIHAWLDEHFHRYRLVEAAQGNVPLEILLAAGRFDAAQLQSSHHRDGHVCDEHCHHDQHQDHNDLFSTWRYETDIPLSLEALRDVARKLPGSVYRCKGVVFSSDAPGQRAVLQVVGKRGDLTLEGEWGDRPRRSRIVAIGAHGKLDHAMLTELFDCCRDTTRTTMTPAWQAA